MSDVKLSVRDLCFSYGGARDAADHVSIDVKPGSFVGLIGPNGSGKSTVLKCIYRALKPDGGSILLDGESLLGMSFRRSALKMAVVGQENDLPFDFTVEEIVAMGRNPHKKLFDADSAEDKAIVAHALEHLGMTDMAGRSYLYLSGGEKQRTMIARAIAQESELLILDEPTNHLDISYQMQIFDLVTRLDTTVLAAIHDLNLAALYCDYVYVLKEGRVILEGAPESVLTEENIRRVYGVSCSVSKHPLTGKVSITFLPEKIKTENKGE